MIEKLAELQVSNRMLLDQLEEQKMDSDYKIAYTQKQYEKRMKAEIRKLILSHQEARDNLEAYIMELAAKNADLER